MKFLKNAEENEESSTILETFENVEEDTNVEEESAGDEIEESHISLEITEDAGNKHGEELQMLKKILASQVDFKNQKPLLQEIIEAKSHRVFDSIPLKYARLSRDLFF